MKKVTKKENFTTIMGILKGLGKSELVEVMAHEIELLDKKANSGKLTKNQENNEIIKDTIIATLQNLAKPATISEITDSNAELKTLSNQKISALLTQLKNAGIVVRTQDKKQALFSLADSE